MTDILEPKSLIALLADLLPTSNKSVSSPNQAIATLVHAIFTVIGFRLVATDDSSTTQPHPDNILPDNWTKEGVVDYFFKYQHGQSNLEFIVKVIGLGPRSLVLATFVQSKNPVESLDICIDDFASPSPYPCDFASGGDILSDVFISERRIRDFAAQLKTKIIQKIIPGLIKEEFVEERTSDDNTARADPPRGNLPTVPELLASSPVSLRSPNRFEIGATDLSPPGIFSQSSGDGMYLGSDHPIWGIGRDPGTRSGSGPWGGDGFLPPMGAPPNARFDPINPIPPSRRGPLRRTGEPDNDEHMPPGPWGGII